MSTCIPLYPHLCSLSLLFLDASSVFTSQQYISGDKHPTAEKVASILAAGGVDVDQARLAQLMKEFEGKKVDDVE